MTDHAAKLAIWALTDRLVGHGHERWLHSLASHMRADATDPAMRAAGDAIDRQLSVVLLTPPEPCDQSPSA